MSAVREDLMSIGEFAAASRLSQKALRLYGEKDVLRPAWVDPDSGYRYYGVEQLQTATLIALLRRAGIPLLEIRSFLRQPSLERLERYELDAAADFAERRRILRYVRRIFEEAPMYQVEIEHVDEQQYVSRTKRVFVRDLEAFIVDTFRELGRDRGKQPGFVLYHGAVNNEEDGPVEVCVPAEEGDKRLPAGEIAFTEITGEQCQFPEILGAYEAVYRWARENGREPNGAAREIYLSGPGPDEELRIAVPLA